jgi:metal-responsive CopG/Arc/MetJ family transcriptional regulator
MGGLREYDRRYTSAMKTAVTIPDRVFQSAEKLAARLSVSRSELYARALASLVEW